jgi:hypothetical protein
VFLADGSSKPIKDIKRGDKVLLRPHSQYLGRRSQPAARRQALPTSHGDFKVVCLTGLSALWLVVRACRPEPVYDQVLPTLLGGDPVVLTAVGTAREGGPYRDRSALFWSSDCSDHKPRLHPGRTRQFSDIAGVAGEYERYRGDDSVHGIVCSGPPAEHASRLCQLQPHRDDLAALDEAVEMDLPASAAPRLPYNSGGNYYPAMLFGGEMVYRPHPAVAAVNRYQYARIVDVWNAHAAACPDGPVATRSSAVLRPSGRG